MPQVLSSESSGPRNDGEYTKETSKGILQEEVASILKLQWGRERVATNLIHTFALSRQCQDCGDRWYGAAPVGSF